MGVVRQVLQVAQPTKNKRGRGVRDEKEIVSDFELSNSHKWKQ
jgi:hypothetical protein